MGDEKSLLCSYLGVFGQLGLGAVKKQSTPKLVEEIAHEKVQLLCCGSFETASEKR